MAQLQPCCLLRSELAAACLAHSPQSHVPGRRKGLPSWGLSQPGHAHHPGTCGCSPLATAQPRGARGEGCRVLPGGIAAHPGCALPARLHRGGEHQLVLPRDAALPSAGHSGLPFSPSEGAPSPPAGQRGCASASKPGCTAPRSIKSAPTSVLGAHPAVQCRWVTNAAPQWGC